MTTAEKILPGKAANFPCRQRGRMVGCVRPNKKLCNEPQPHFALASTAVCNETWQFQTQDGARSTPNTLGVPKVFLRGRAKCLLRDASKCAHFVSPRHVSGGLVLGRGCATQPMTMKRTKPNTQKTTKPDAAEQLLDCWQNISALATLLESCAGVEWVSADAVARTGTMLLRETDKLCDVLQKPESLKVRSA